MNVRANKHLLLWSSLATFFLLGWAAYEENSLQEWRRVQRDYRSRLAEGAADFKVQLRQIVVPALGVTDRCVSCHVGMAPGEKGIEGHPLFRRHPDVVHDPGEYGCTVCHSGQGRATEREAAHGTALHWPEPMIPARYAYAGCGICHTHLEVPRLAVLERGRTLVERFDCLACHALDGRGGTLRPGAAAAATGPDLSRLGARAIDAGWYERHLAQRDTSRVPAWRASFARIEAADRDAIEVLLRSRVGAPGLVESKAVFHSQGCRGCHKVGGVGGDDGPDLTRAGQMDPGQRDFTHVAAGRSVAAWIAEHFRRPGVLAPGSAMPELGLAEEDIEALTFYMLSLRRAPLPDAYWPNDRVRAERFGAREFATDGATLYGTFCAACHGAEGQGMRYPGMAAFPAIANPDFLAVVPDTLLLESVRHGRRGRRMPAWGESEGGLRPQEIRAVVAYVRQLGGVQQEPDPRPRRWVAGDAGQGGRLYAAHCGACHGDRGQGGEGPALADARFLGAATDTYLVESIGRGRRGTSMQGFATASVTRPALAPEEIEAIVAYLRTWEAEP